jgi:hypothetical protein
MSDVQMKGARIKLALLHPSFPMIPNNLLQN